MEEMVELMTEEEIKKLVFKVLCHKKLKGKVSIKTTKI